ncbi:MAG TPA: cell wall hydrolase [Rhizomicrobium sp.]|jgi:hypothetical protein
MTQKIGDALRRSDCALAGAVFLALSTVAAAAALAPPSDNAAPRLRVLPAEDKVSEELPPLPLAAPEIAPLPRPNPIARIRIQVALENLASEASCLAEAMYYEARGEGLAGEKAIAEVVVHRTQRGGFPHSICGVVHQGQGEACQFSFLCNGAADQPKDTADWSRAVRRATQILTGALPLNNITEGAIAFHATAVQPDWPGMVPTVRIGNHLFFRRPGHTRSI